MDQHAGRRVVGATATIMLLNLPVAMRSITRQGTAQTLPQPSRDMTDRAVSTSGANDDDPVLSPDHQHVVFRGTTRADWQAATSLIVTGVDGGDPLGMATASPPIRPARSPARQNEKTAGEWFKNIQVFKELPESELMQAMFFMKASLGVSCTHCHADFVNFEKDDRPAKKMARNMIRMVRALNKESFDARDVVNCNTCHRGQSRPSAPLAFAPIVRQQPAANSAEVPSGAAKPAVDQVFDRYVEATGGKVAQEHLATLVMTGSKMASEGWTARLENYEKSPGKSLATFELQGSWQSGFNGTTGWSQDNQGVHPLDGKDLALFRLKSSFLRPSTLKGLYTGLAFAGTEAVAGNAAYVIEGTLTGAGLQKLFFDIQSGRLVRITASAETTFGPIPEEFDLEDYRSVGGVTLPFTISDLKPDFSYIDRLDKVRTNVPVDDARFERPTLKR